MIIHDSVFINAYMDFHVEEFKMIWDFEHHWDQIDDETMQICVFNDPDLLEFHRNKGRWTGCFGAMSIITHDFLSRIYSQV